MVRWLSCSLSHQRDVGSTSGPGDTIHEKRTQNVSLHNVIKRLQNGESVSAGGCSDTPLTVSINQTEVKEKDSCSWLRLATCRFVSSPGAVLLRGAFNWPSVPSPSLDVTKSLDINKLLLLSWDLSCLASLPSFLLVFLFVSV